VIVNRRDTLIALVALGAMAGTASIDAQFFDAVRRIGVLMGYSETDPEAQVRLSTLKERLQAFGWSEGRNLRIDVRWSSGNAERALTAARELVALQPEVIVSSTTPATAALQRETATIPIVFTVVADPVGSGFVKALSRPGGNITGFVNLESSLVGKWLELLKEIAPRVTQVAVMINPDTAPYADQYLRPIVAAASKMGVRLASAAVRNDSDIEDAVAALARLPSAGLIVMVDSFMVVHRKAAIGAVARHKVPAVYFSSFNVREGGPISYGVDVVDQFRRAGGYVDQILRGAKVAELPVQMPATFELAINRKTANALGITIPQSLLLRANEVIE
jgi:putative ABC transport system substrate-binding protein